MKDFTGRRGYPGKSKQRGKGRRRSRLSAADRAERELQRELAGLGGPIGDRV